PGDLPGIVDYPAVVDQHRHQRLAAEAQLLVVAVKAELVSDVVKSFVSECHPNTPAVSAVSHRVLADEIVKFHRHRADLRNWLRAMMQRAHPICNSVSSGISPGFRVMPMVAR